MWEIKDLLKQEVPLLASTKGPLLDTLYCTLGGGGGKV